WETYDVVRPYTVMKPVYEQHYKEQRTCVNKTVVHAYQEPVRWTTYRPEYTQHVKECRYVVQKPTYQEYQVPVRWTTYRHEYQQHEVDVPCVTYRTEMEPRQRTYTTVTCEPVWTEKQICVATGEWQAESCYVPGPVVNKCCRMPGTWTLDPCT